MVKVWALELEQPGSSAAGRVPMSTLLPLSEPQFPPRSVGPHGGAFLLEVWWHCCEARQLEPSALEMVPKQQ